MAQIVRWNKKLSKAHWPWFIYVFPSLFPLIGTRPRTIKSVHPPFNFFSTFLFDIAHVTIFSMPLDSNYTLVLTLEVQPFWCLNVHDISDIETLQPILLCRVVIFADWNFLQKVKQSLDCLKDESTFSMLN